MKICTKCNKSKDKSCFGPFKRSKDKLDYWCKECKSQSARKWIDSNPQKKEEYKEATNKRMREKRKSSPEVVREYDRKYYCDNKQKVVDRTKRYLKNKYHTDITFKLTALLRGRIRHALKNYKGVKKASKTLDLIGCSIEELKLHLESLFIEGMSWENQGQWHIDHIKPCASFDLTDIEQQKICFHYTNLQPLWAIDNKRKSNKII